MASEWNSEPLDRLVDPARGISYGIVQPGAPTNDGVPIVRVSDIRDGRISTNEPLRVSRSIEAAYSRTRLRGGELLLTLVGTVGEAAVAPASLEGWNTARAVAVIPVRDDIGSYWVKLALQGPDIQHIIASRLNTTVQATLNLRDVAKLPIVMPPASERRRIAHILGTLDDKIELTRQMSATLEAMARALFESWFVKFEPVRAKAEGRDTRLPADIAALFPDGFEMSEIGEVPKGWRVSPVGSIVTLMKGCSYRSSELAQSRTALVTLKSFLRGGGYRRNGLKEFVGSYKATQVLASGELVVALTDVTQNADVIGCPARIPSRTPYQTLVASPDVGILRSQNSTPWQPYIYFSLLSTSTRDAVKACASGTTVLHLDVKAFGAVPLIVPANDLLETFGAVIANIWTREDCNSVDCDTLTQIRDTLLPKLISGDLRVPDAERFLADAGVS